MSVGRAQREESLRDAEDQLGDVEGPEDVLGENLALLDEREGLLGRSSSVIEVHGSRGDLDKVGPGHGGNQADAVAVHPAPNRNDHGSQLERIGERNLTEELPRSVVRPALVGLPTLVSEVVPVRLLK